MARRFNSALSAYLIAESTPITGTPLSFAAWFTGNSGALVSLQRGAGLSGSYDLLINSSTVTVRTTNTAGAFNSATAGTVRTQPFVWQHAGGVIASNVSRKAYYNGVVGSENTTDTTGATAARITSGMRETSSGLGFLYTGLMADVAIWNVSLTDAEMALLAAGKSPLEVRPGSLKAYWPYASGLMGGEFDVIANREMVNTLSVPWEHPPFLARPTRRIRGRREATAPTFQAAWARGANSVLQVGR